MPNQPKGIEETLDKIEKYWDTDRTEATKVIMRYAETYAKQEVEKALLAEKEDLEYCTTCIQMTNHRDSKCLKCLAEKDNGEIV